MSTKDQFDNNQLEQNNNKSEQQKEFDSKKIEKNIHEAKIWGELGSLDGKIETSTENIEKKVIDDKPIKNIENKNIQYTTPTQDSPESLLLANKGRVAASQNLQENIQKYPGLLGKLIRYLDNK